MGKNVAVFVDVANIFYAAKAAGVDIDYVTLLKSAVAGRDFVRAYAYTGLDPDNENQRNFHNFLSRHGYKVVSKDIRKYGDGKVKANLDIELVVDMMKTARNLDVAIIVSGDGDFAPAIRAVQEMGVRCEVISFRGNTSSDLMDVADLFTDITAIARVEKGSSRSGRRVAGADEDLSMTEVPDKQTEGTGRGRTRTPRGRGRVGEAEPVAASGRRGGRRPAAEVAETVGGPSLTVLPGEKLSRVRAPLAAETRVTADRDAPIDDDREMEPLPLEGAASNGSGEPTDEEGRRRRRRRGGRGRGRGRGRGEGAEQGLDEGIAQGAERGLDNRIEPIEPIESLPARARLEALPEDEPPPARRAPRAATFGSVWDTQIGVARPPTSAPSLPSDEFDDEFDDEPAIPEYLIAERRGASRGPAAGRGGRGGGGARAGYSAAVDRERYGRGGSSGINRYPDVSGRTGGGSGGGIGGGSGGGGGRGGRDVREAPRRDDRGYGRGGDRPQRQERGAGAPRPGEQWSEVPPELEAVLRAQLAARGGQPAPSRSESRPPSGRSSTAPMPSGEREAELSDAIGVPDVGTGAPEPTRRRGRRPAATAGAAEATSEATTEVTTGTGTTARHGRPRSAGAAGNETAAAPPRRSTRARATTGEETAQDPAPPQDAAPAQEAAPTAPTRRRSTRAAAGEATTGEASSDSSAAGPKRRTTRPRSAAQADAGSEASPAADAAAPKRRTTRRSATPEA